MLFARPQTNETNSDNYAESCFVTSPLKLGFVGSVNRTASLNARGSPVSRSFGEGMILCLSSEIAIYWNLHDAFKVKTIHQNTHNCSGHEKTEPIPLLI